MSSTCSLSHLAVGGLGADDLLEPELHLGEVCGQRQERRVELLLLLLHVMQLFQLCVRAGKETQDWTGEYSTGTAGTNE